MNDTFVTFHGWVGAEVRHRHAKGLSVASMRVAVTPRLKKGSDWVDGETTWYTVTAWRTLADHVRTSVRKGDAVIVHGRLRTETWKPEGGSESTTLQVEASFIGHDLSRGTSTFAKAVRPERVDPQDLESEVKEMIHEMQEDMTPMDSWGETREPDHDEDGLSSGGLGSGAGRAHYAA